ncbi:hypothetical protein AVEN_112272-1, partial [Araneus ventricosus]
DQIPPGFPQFTMQPQIQGVEMGRNALLPCRAEGTPTPTIRWLKSYIPVDMSDPRYSLVQGCKLCRFSFIISANSNSTTFSTIFLRYLHDIARRPG